MNISRRKFLAAAPVVAGAVLQLQGTALGQRGSTTKLSAELPDADALSRLEWDSFYPFINTEFNFGTGGKAASLTLISMKDTGPEGSAKGTAPKCFVMKFQGPYYQPLAEKTYNVNHFNLGDFDLFITDGGRAGRVQTYNAVINRIVS